MERKLGIQNIKLALGFAIRLGMQVDKKLDDGKITLWEALGLIPELKALPGIIRNADQIKAEIADLDESEKAELLEWFKKEFDLRNDNIEHIIEVSAECIASLSSLVSTFQTNKENTVGGGGPGGDPDGDG